MSIGKNIKQIRDKHNLTQKQLAKIAGVTDKAVSMWEMEKREPRMGAIQKISDFLGISKSMIIDEPPFSSNNKEDFLNNNSFICIDDFSFDKYNTVFDKDSHPTKTYYLLQTTENMAPFILKNDKLIIEHDQDIKNNCCYAVIVDKLSACINRVVLSQNGIELISDNPYFPKRFFDFSEQGRLQFIGKVKKIIRDL